MSNGLDRYYTFDRPLEYKGITLYPVKLRDYHLFMTLVSCLFLEKNSIRDPQLAMKAISMSYIEFLIGSADENNKYLYLLDGLLRLVLNQMDNPKFSFLLAKDEGGRLGFVINGVRFTTHDFDEIRIIISEQNGLELPNELMQKDVRGRL
jgi:hypothetical protein